MRKENKREQAVSDYLSGGGSLRKLAKKYGIGSTSLYNWVMAEKQKKKKAGLRKKVVLEKEKLPEDIAVLQEELLMARLEVELLKAMIDVADEELGTNIRKKTGARQS